MRLLHTRAQAAHVLHQTLLQHAELQDKLVKSGARMPREMALFIENKAVKEE